MRVPYALVAAVKSEERHAQMAAALATGLPRLRPVGIDDRRSLTIAGYGPSLADTWPTIERPVLSMSGATRFLADLGLTPDWHIDMDPRPYKTRHIDPPIAGVRYLMASCCHPRAWEVLRGQDVTLWHAVSDKALTPDWVVRHDPGQVLVSTGSNVGLAALQLGGLLGFRHFEVHGMDGSIRAGARHAAEHYGKVQRDGTTWDAGGVTYQTSRIMANGVAELLNYVAWFPIFCVFHGEGLTQALVREAGLENACCADEVEKVARVRRARAHVFGRADQGLARLVRAALADPPAQWRADVAAGCAEAEGYRARARFNTGTVPPESALLLRVLCEFLRPRVAIEVGTFIGTSTLAMRVSEHLYTCDKDNDCLPARPGLTCFPGRTSTAMLAELAARGVRADLYFVDGRLQLPDIPLVLRCSHAATLYVFDDYVGREKGVANVERLGLALPRHVLIRPEEFGQVDGAVAALAPDAWVRS